MTPCASRALVRAVVAAAATVLTPACRPEVARTPAPTVPAAALRKSRLLVGFALMSMTPCYSIYQGAKPAIVNSILRTRAGAMAHHRRTSVATLGSGIGHIR